MTYQGLIHGASMATLWFGYLRIVQSKIIKNYIRFDFEKK